MTHRKAALVLAVGALVALAPGTLAGNPFAKSDSTEGGYATWDADLIDIEEVGETGEGVYVAVLDTGLTANWKDYFPDARVAQELGKGFYQSVTFKAKSTDGCELDTYTGALHQVSYIGSRGSTHGTHVASTIIGYSYDSNFDAVGGFPLPPIQVRGIAPNATIIPVKVLADYQIPALPKCATPTPSQLAVFGTEEMVAAGIDYVTSLKKGVLEDSAVVINMSLGGDAGVPVSAVEKAAIDRAIAAGVVVVAAASNDGEAGMSAPGSYAPVISAGSVGWTGEWLYPGDGPRYRMWWLQDTHGDLTPPLPAGSGDVADPTVVEDVYVSDFSSREHPGQDLDVMAPGSWVRGPYPGLPGYNHLPWWSSGIGDLMGNNASNFYYVGGTSMATPHVASVAALLLEKDPTLTGPEIEAILESTALSLPATGSRDIWDNTAAATITWDTDCDGTACDAVGSGLVQADAAVDSLP